MSERQDRPPVPFALGTYSVSASPGFPALVFDDGAAVALEAILPLAGKCGIRLSGASSLSGLLADWDWNFQALSRLVDILAYDEIARGYRGGFMPEEFLKAGKLLSEPRQVFRAPSTASGVFVARPHTVLGQPSDPLFVPEDRRGCRANFAIAVIMGRMLRNADEAEAMAAIAGFSLATEIVDLGAEDTFGQLSLPAMMPLGPLMVPSAFMADPKTVEFQLGLNGPPLVRATLDTLLDRLGPDLARLSRQALLLPGDIVTFGDAASADRPALVDGDIVEAVATGLGRQMINIQMKEG